GQGLLFRVEALGPLVLERLAYLGDGHAYLQMLVFEFVNGTNRIGLTVLVESEINPLWLLGRVHLDRHVRAQACQFVAADHYLLRHFSGGLLRSNTLQPRPHPVPFECFEFRLRVRWLPRRNRKADQPTNQDGRSHVMSSLFEIRLTESSFPVHRAAGG